MSNIQDFAKTIQEYVHSPIAFNEDLSYLDLSLNKTFCKDKLLEIKNNSPHHSPLAEAVCLIIKSMQDCHLFKTKIGVNEFFKSPRYF